MIGGRGYLFDATWGNNASEVLGACSYEYLNLTDADLSGTHAADMELELPECVSREANYYTAEGLYFETYDRDAAGEVIGRRYEDGERTASVRFADESACGQARQGLIEGGQMLEYCPGLSRFSYMENEKLHILTFSW